MNKTGARLLHRRTYSLNEVPLFKSDQTFHYVSIRSIRLTNIIYIYLRRVNEQNINIAYRKSFVSRQILIYLTIPQFMI